jgi:phosphodiesterase/alkaline phosphatase D-like protein
MDMSRRTLIVGGTSAIVGAGVGARTEIRVHRARLANLAPDTDYVYAAVHDGASPAVGSVRTAPPGSRPSFGDQSTVPVW